MAKVNETRLEKLAKAPSRTRTAIDRRVLTDGTLEDYRDGQVVVRTLNGSLRSFAPHDLSNEDWCFVTAWWEIPAECRFEDERCAVRNSSHPRSRGRLRETCHNHFT